MRNHEISRYEHFADAPEHPPHTQWSDICYKVNKILFYISLWRSRWLWFFTAHNLVVLFFCLFIGFVLRHAVFHETLTSGLVQYQKAIDIAQDIDSRLEAYENKHITQYHDYYVRLMEIEKDLKRSIENIRSELWQAVNEVRGELKGYVNQRVEKVRSDAEEHSKISDDLTTIEKQINDRLAFVESRVDTINSRIVASTNSCVRSSAVSELANIKMDETRRRHAINLASRSHGAFVVPHLTSKAVASGSMLYNLVDAVIGLETYNLAITERTHITPSEAFCFEGAEGTQRMLVPHLTSKAVASGSMLYNLVDAVIGLETYNLAITERTHITPSEAFCFEGAEGKLTIRLWTNASVEAVEYEHDYWSSVVPISAPDLYDVKACLDSECEQAVLLAQCRYPNDVREGPVQVCTMQNRSVATNQVQIVFRTNHGQEYTCIYQLRVLKWK
ncbi:hypothetical protein Q1695_014873 [Nippostrongylus brasiliensis]|nr:hypothetical protein Q1695_014873 [Nippostrongylus brasiliensis]